MGDGMDTEKSRLKPVLITFTTIVVFCLALAFFWRVFSFYRQIQNGNFDYSALKFDSTKVNSAALEKLSEGAPGSGDLATDDDPSLGKKNAPVTIVEFADFGCPYSAEESYVVRAIAKAFPDDVRVIYRDFPIPELHPGADIAAMGGECAKEQGKFWEYHDALFSRPTEYTADNLASYAEDAGLDARAFSACLASGKYESEVGKDLADGVKAGVVGTPTFFINGVKIEGDIPYSIFTEVIHAFLKK